MALLEDSCSNLLVALGYMRNSRPLANPDTFLLLRHRCPPKLRHLPMQNLKSQRSQTIRAMRAVALLVRV